MKLDRDLQKKTLEALSERYPDEMEFLDLRKIVVGSGAEYGDEEHFWANLIYLGQHGLVRNTPPIDEHDEGCSAITHKGLDFLADDGGLSAILGVVMIKLHDDTLKSLIEAKILASDLPQPDKKRWLDQLRSMPAETTKHLVLKLVDLGLANTPAALAAIGTLLSQAGTS
uniref:hypothetical protein n=1 Tax=Castellaniella defragrans TaxID=75697 RepID=UPI00333E66D3